VGVISTIAIGAILLAAMELREHKGDLKLCGLGKHEKIAFERLGVLKILEIYKTEKKALDSFLRSSK